jgi:hypothetical protein
MRLALPQERFGLLLFEKLDKITSQGIRAASFFSASWIRFTREIAGRVYQRNDSPARELSRISSQVSDCPVVKPGRPRNRTARECLFLAAAG